jgi:hypothetical protein
LECIFYKHDGKIRTLGFIFTFICGINTENIFGMERNELIKKLRTDLRQLDQILSQWKGSEAEISHLRGLSSEMLEGNLRLIFLSESTPAAMDPLPMFGIPQPAPKPPVEVKTPEPVAPVKPEVKIEAPKKMEQEEVKEVVQAVEEPKPTVAIPDTSKKEQEVSVTSKPENHTAAPPEVTAPPVPTEKQAPTEKLLSRLVDAVAPPRLEDKLRNTKVEDLKKAIPLHEKFLYINELYQGEHGLYNAFIEILNQCKDHKEADQQFKLEIKGRGWDSEGEIVTKLWTTVQRKFPIA